MTASRDKESRIRETVFELLPKLQSRVYDLVYHYVEELSDLKIGPKSKRVGVFGPHTSDWKHLIDEIARHISRLDFASITGNGYYLPRDADTIHPIWEILPSEFQTGLFPILYYGRIMVRIVSKAVFLMNLIRSQVVELEASADYGIPAMGLIVHDQIAKSEGKDCSFLFLEEESARCVVPHPSLCPATLPRRPFCPFVDSAHLSYWSLDILHQKNSRLVAVRDMSRIQEILNDFLIGQSGRG